MTRPRLALWLLGLAIAGVALAQAPFLVPPEVTWNQRLTLVVQTPTGEVSASSVTEVTAQDNTQLVWAPPEAGGLQTSFRGEAVALEVAPDRWLFALLDGAGGQWAWAAFDLGRDEGLAESFRALREVPLDAPAPLPREAWPRMVTFDDLADPTSVRAVDPDDLAATFGAGVALSAVTLAVTEDAVTAGRVETVLLWLREIWPNRLDGERFMTIRATNRLANDLSSNSFSTEISK